ncbi:MAG: hypothetical protein DRO00_03885 [Thermoproteota archaeon]|nr:MAG: hypothetical protein DRO00_03885 [Candidatus Korarchaeota archaeon]
MGKLSATREGLGGLLEDRAGIFQYARDYGLGKYVYEKTSDCVRTILIKQKARIGRRSDYETLMLIKELSDLGIIKVDRRAIYEGLEPFEEGEREKILRILEKLGILKLKKGSRSSLGSGKEEPGFFWCDHELGRVRL